MPGVCQTWSQGLSAHTVKCQPLEWREGWRDDCTLTLIHVSTHIHTHITRPPTPLQIITNFTVSFLQCHMHSQWEHHLWHLASALNHRVREHKHMCTECRNTNAVTAYHICVACVACHTHSYEGLLPFTAGSCLECLNTTLPVLNVHEQMMDSSLCFQRWTCTTH